MNNMLLFKQAGVTQTYKRSLPYPHTDGWRTEHRQFQGCWGLQTLQMACCLVQQQPIFCTSCSYKWKHHAAPLLSRGFGLFAWWTTFKYTHTTMYSSIMTYYRMKNIFSNRLICSPLMVSAISQKSNNYETGNYILPFRICELQTHWSLTSLAQMVKNKQTSLHYLSFIIHFDLLKNA